MRATSRSRRCIARLPAHAGTGNHRHARAEPTVAERLPAPTTGRTVSVSTGTGGGFPVIPRAISRAAASAPRRRSTGDAGARSNAVTEFSMLAEMERRAQPASPVRAPASSARFSDEGEPESATDIDAGEQTSNDDPVRDYLHEIGRIPLLNGSDEQRLARSIEEASHCAQLESAFATATGRRPD